MKVKCKIISGSFASNKREEIEQDSITKEGNNISFVYSDNDTLESLETQLNSMCGNSSFLYAFKKRFSTSFLSFISVVIILFALISSSLYEDILKKFIFESPLVWTNSDSISIIFVLLFFFGLLMMPSILDGESSQLKDGLQSWFNKDTRVLKRLRLALKELDKKYVIHLYNIDLLEDNHWVWRLLMPSVLSYFIQVKFYVRNDQKKRLESRLKKLACTDIEIISLTIHSESKNSVDLFLVEKEKMLYTLMQLSSTALIQNEESKKFVSLEMFEYLGRNFLEEKGDTSQLISGFQNFINRCFDDFNLLRQHKSVQVYFSHNVKYQELEDERRRLSYYLRNHIEECLEYFDNPISLLVLYYYVKDIVLDEKRTVAILEKLIFSIKNKQQYDLVQTYWFDIAQDMFDAKDIDNFELTNDSLYRKLSIESLNNLMFLFERNGRFNQALLIAQYLYEINPKKYAIDTCSLYERMGQFDNAYKALPLEVALENNEKPTDIQVRYFQRKAWMIVSKRWDEQKDEGLESILKLEKLLYSHNLNNEPLWLWHYYNIKANYAEWNELYDEAIEHYKKCLSIPALGAFEYGATFVNMAIAYRFKYIASHMSDVSLIEQSIHLGQIGVTLKESVGDRDEMPVVLHNQALNILYKLISVEDESLIQNVITLTSNAIEILDSTSSVKRLGMMLCESIIAKSILGLDVDDLRSRLQEHWTTMDAYEIEQINGIFDRFVKKEICKPLDI